MQSIMLLGTSIKRVAGMSWFNIIKAGTYYHITSPELANEIVENQVITNGVDSTMPWMKDEIARRKEQPISGYTTVSRMPKEARKLRDAEGRLRERSPQWADKYYKDNPKQLQEWKEKLQDKGPLPPKRIGGNIPPAGKIVLFWKDLDDAKAYYNETKYNAQMEDISDETKLVIVKCDLEIDLVKYPRRIAVHTPTERDDTPRQTSKHIFEPTFNEHGISNSPIDSRTGKAKRVYDYKTRFNTEMLSSAYYYPRKEIITGKFEVMA